MSLKLHLFVNCVLFAPLAVFFKCKFFSRIFFIFCSVIVTSSALFTTQMYSLSHFISIIYLARRQEASLLLKLGLCNDLCYNTGTNSSTTLTDSKSCSLFESDWSNEFNIDLNIITRHNHLSSCLKLN